MVKAKERNHTFDHILNVFAWLSFFVAVVLAVMVLFSSFSDGEKGKSIFGYKLFIVRSDSMKLSSENANEDVFFETGDLIFVKAVDSSTTIKEGDVITFISCNPDSSGKTISHKVRSVVKDSNGALLGYETYGINTGVSDEALVDPSTIIGVYVGKSQVLGRLFNFFKTPAGYFTSILIPCVLLIIFFSIKVGIIISRKDILKKYDFEVEELRNKLLELERNRQGVYMKKDMKDMAVTPDVLTEQVAQQNNGAVNPEQPAFNPSQQFNQGQPFNPAPYIQGAGYNDRVLEIMANTLGKAVDSLTRTIDTLAVSVGKPVDTLTRSVETLVNAAIRPTVVEKVVEKPVTETVIPTVSEPIKCEEVVKEEVAKEEVAVTQDISEEVIKEPVQPIQVEEVKPIQEEAQPVESEPTSIFDSFNTREKIPFNKKLLGLSGEVKQYFSEVHNELISFKKVNYRISNKCITYKSGRKALAKIIVRGKTLKLHLALELNDYPKTVYFQEDASNVKAYEEVPFTVKIKSTRAMNNAIKLINSLAEKNSLNKQEQFQKEDVLTILKKIK